MSHMRQAVVLCRLLTLHFWSVQQSCQGHAAAVRWRFPGRQPKLTTAPLCPSVCRALWMLEKEEASENLSSKKFPTFLRMTCALGFRVSGFGIVLLEEMNERMKVSKPTVIHDLIWTWRFLRKNCGPQKIWERNMERWQGSVARTRERVQDNPGLSLSSCKNCGRNLYF